MSHDRLHIALLGPAEPKALAQHLDGKACIPDGLGGIPVNELADGLLALGHRVSIYTCSRAVSTTVRLGGERLNITVVPLRHRARDRALDFFRQERRNLERELKKTSADVVHAHWTYEFALAAIKSGISPVLVTAHDAPLTILRLMPDAYRLIRAVMAIRVRLAIRELTAVSPYLAQRWRKEMLYRRPIPVIANIVPQLPAAASSIERSRWMVLDVADGSRRKNVVTLLRAFARVVTRIPQAELRLVGSGLGPQDPIAAWARSRRLDTNVAFVGPVDHAHIADEYARASVFCHASLEEAQPMVLLEALHAGLVVIGGKHAGGVPWTLLDGRAGRLVDVESASAVADAIESALAQGVSDLTANPDLVRAINARHGKRAVAQAYVAVYRRLISDAEMSRAKAIHGLTNGVEN